MSHPGGGNPKDFGQTAKLALLTIGTIATGALGVIGLAAGYKVKKDTAPDPEKVTPQTYFDDLTHLIPPWQHKGESDSPSTGGWTEPDESSSSSSSSSSSLRGMDRNGFGSSHRERENEAKSASRYHRNNDLEEEARHRQQIEIWEAKNTNEERQLTPRYERELFEDIEGSLPLPVSSKMLWQICSYLPYESLIVLSGVNKSLRTFADRLLADPGIQLQQARSAQGFNEVLRGRIWMRISGAQHRANKMRQKASAEATVTFYEHLLALSIGYREAIVQQNHGRSPGAVGRHSPSFMFPSGGPNSPSPNYDIDGLTTEERAALDTILKDVPRTMVAANPASKSLISNIYGEDDDAEQQVEGHDGALPSSSSSHKSILDGHLQTQLTSLSHLLSVYSLHDRELGYCQGMNFVAYYFLTKLPEQDAYWLFYSVMQDKRWNLRDFYLNDLKGLLLCKYQFNFLLELYMPELCAHFQAQDLHSDILTEWFMTFFTYSSFPRRYPLLDRIWDCMIIMGGTKMLHRIALSILYLSQQTLLASEFEDIIHYLKILPDDGILNPDIILPIALDHFKISNKALAELEQRYEEDIRESDESRRRKEQIQANKAKAATPVASSQASQPESESASPPAIVNPIITISPPPASSSSSSQSRSEGQALP